MPKPPPTQRFTAKSSSLPRNWGPRKRELGKRSTPALRYQGRQETFYRVGSPVLTAALVIAAADDRSSSGAIAWWLYARHFESTDDAFIDGHAVQMAPKIAGYVTRLNIADNQLVHQGDVLIEIDPRDSQVALDAAKAAKASAVGRLAQATAQIEAADQQVKRPRPTFWPPRRPLKMPCKIWTRNSNLAARSGQPTNARCFGRRRPGRPPPKRSATRARASAASRKPAWPGRNRSTAEADVQQSASRNRNGPN